MSNEKYDVLKMNEYIDNLSLKIFPDANTYLIGTNSEEGQRFLKEETLSKFRVGVGQERFYD